MQETKNKVRSFQAGGTVYDIPVSQVGEFLKDMPEAQEIRSFTVDKDTFDIPMVKLPEFKQDMPDAKPLHDYEETDYGPFDPERVAKDPQTKQNFKTWQQQTNGKLQQNANVAPGQDQQQVNIPEKEGYLKRFNKNLANNWLQGSASLGSWIADAPALIYDLAGSPFRAVGLNVPTAEDFKGGVLENVSDYFKGQSKAYEEKIRKVNPNFEKGTIEAFKQDGIGSGIMNLTGSITQSMPASIAMILSGGSTTPTILASATVFGAGKVQELDENAPEMNYDKRRLVGAINGTLEGIFETYLGSGAVGKALSGIVKNAGKNVAEKQIKRSLSTVFADMITKSPWLAPFGEGFEEIGTQISQNLVDKYSGYRPDLNIMEGVGDAFLAGIGMGGIHGATIGLAKYAVEKAQGQQPATTVQPEAPQLTPQQKVQAQAEEEVKSLINQSTGQIEQVNLTTLGTEDNIPVFISNKIQEQGEDGKINEIFFLVDESGQPILNPDGKLGFSAGQITFGEDYAPVTPEDYVSQRVANFDQQEQQKELLAENKIVFNGKVIEHLGENKWQDEDYNPVEVPEGFLQQFEQLKAELQVQTPKMVSRVYGKFGVRGTFDEAGNLVVKQPMGADQVEELRKAVELATNMTSTVISTPINETDLTNPLRSVSIVPKTNTTNDNISTATTGTGASTENKSTQQTNVDQTGDLQKTENGVSDVQPELKPYPKDKDGNPDIDKMDAAQLFQFNTEKFGLDRAIASVTKSIKLKNEKISAIKKKIEKLEGSAETKALLEIEKLNNDIANLQGLLPKKQAPAIKPTTEATPADILQAEITELEKGLRTVREEYRSKLVAQIQAKKAELEAMLNPESVNNNLQNQNKSTETKQQTVENKPIEEKQVTASEQKLSTLNNLSNESTEEKADNQAGQEELLTAPAAYVPKTLDQYESQEFKDFVNLLISNPVNLNGIKLGGLTPKEVQAGIKNVLEGKTTIAANTLLESLENIFNSGEVNFKLNSSSTVQSISLDEFMSFVNNQPELNETELLASSLIPDDIAEAIISIDENLDYNQLFKDYLYESETDSEAGTGVQDFEAEEEVRGNVEEKEVEKEEFDFADLFNEIDRLNTPEGKAELAAQKKAEEEAELEKEYQNSSYSKKWAATRKEAIEKLTKQYNDAKAKKAEWEAKVYKKHGGSVEVGKDNDFDLNEVSIDRINQKRKDNAIKAAETEMKEALDDLKALKVPKEQIDALVTPVSDQLPEAGKKVEVGTPVEKNETRDDYEETAKEVLEAGRLNLWIPTQMLVGNYPKIRELAAKAGIEIPLHQSEFENILEEKFGSLANFDNDVNSLLLKPITDYLTKEQAPVSTPKLTKEQPTLQTLLSEFNSLEQAELDGDTAAEERRDELRIQIAKLKKEQPKVTDKKISDDELESLRYEQLILSDKDILTEPEKLRLKEIDKILSQYEDPELHDYKQDEEETPSRTELFKLKPTNTIQDLLDNINSILEQYSGRKMAAIQAEAYMTEFRELGKQYLAENGIKTKEELHSHFAKLQAKLRAGKGNERKAALDAIKQEKQDAVISDIEKMALEAEAEIQQQIKQADEKPIAQPGQIQAEGGNQPKQGEVNPQEEQGQGSKKGLEKDVVNPSQPQIDKLKSEITSLQGEIKRKEKEINERNGLFGDGVKAPNNLFGLQGFDMNNARKVIEGIKAEIGRKQVEIDKLTKAGETALKEVQGQQELVIPEVPVQQPIEAEKEDFSIIGSNSEWNKGLQDGKFAVLVPKGTLFKDIDKNKVVGNGKTSANALNLLSKKAKELGLNLSDYEIYQIVDGNTPDAFAYTYSIDGNSFERTGTISKKDKEVSPTPIKVKADWDIEFTQGHNKGQKLSELPIESVDMYEDNVSSVNFQDGGTFQGMLVKNLTGALSITQTPVKIAVILDSKMSDNAGKLARIQRIANNSGTVVVENPGKTRDDRQFPFMFVPKSQAENYTIPEIFRTPIQDRKYYLNQEIAQLLINDGTFEKQIKEGRDVAEVIKYIENAGLPVPKSISDQLPGKVKEADQPEDMSKMVEETTKAFEELPSVWENEGDVPLSKEVEDSIAKQQQDKLEKKFLAATTTEKIKSDLAEFEKNPNNNVIETGIELNENNIWFSVSKGKIKGTYNITLNYSESTGFYQPNKSVSNVTEDGVVKFVQEQMVRLANRGTPAMMPSIVSEYYHKAKKDGKNPQLVAEVEKLLADQPAPVSKVKEAWEMTREEWNNYKNHPDINGEEISKLRGGGQLSDAWAIETFLKENNYPKFTELRKLPEQERTKITSEFKESKYATFGYFDTFHKESVRQAIKDGKTIPAEVKAEYPELFEEKENQTKGEIKNILNDLVNKIADYRLDMSFLNQPFSPSKEEFAFIFDKLPVSRKITLENATARDKGNLSTNNVKNIIKNGTAKTGITFNDIFEKYIGKSEKPTISEYYKTNALIQPPVSEDKKEETKDEYKILPELKRRDINTTDGEFDGVRIEEIKSALKLYDFPYSNSKERNELYDRISKNAQTRTALNKSGGNGGQIDVVSWNDLIRELNTTPEVKKEGTPIAVKLFKTGSGGTKGVFKDKNGKLYKSLVPQEGVFENGVAKRVPIKDKLTDEHTILSELQDKTYIPKVGKVVETSEGKAFEIEELQEADNITKEEYLKIRQQINELNNKGYFISDKVSVMRRMNGELVITDFSNAYKESRGNRDLDALMDIEDKLSPKDKAWVDLQKSADHTRKTAELFKGDNKPNEYLLTQRPPSIGTHPIDGLIGEPKEQKMNGRDVWKLTYEKPLSAEDVRRFELSPVLPLSEYMGKIVDGITPGFQFYIRNIQDRTVTLEAVAPNGKRVENTMRSGEFLEKVQNGELTLSEPNIDELSQPEVLSPEKGEEQKPIEKIEDFGEKIGGAKKMVYQRLAEITQNDIIKDPLSKTFPRPDFVQLVKDGTLSEDAAFLLKFVYESIPAKPRQPHRVKSWASTVQNAIDLYSQLLQDKNTADQLVEKVANSAFLKQKYGSFLAVQRALGFPAEDINTGAYEIKVFISVDNRKTYSVVKGGYIISDHTSVEEAAGALKNIISQNKDKSKETKFAVYQDHDTKKYFIGKETATGVLKLIQGYDSARDAFAALKTQRPQLEELWEGMKIRPQERRKVNRKRVGTDYRNGKNVSPNQFTETFGFRGTQFGNWVKNDERQESLNDAYDALMDLATALNVSPRALSLGGQLGMAFGARGSGDASAHYEPGQVVINLTKTKGAGSLAHEWWHALDSYFARTRGEKDGFLTQKPRQGVIVKNDNGKREVVPDERVRLEIHEAFKAVVEAIRNSGMTKRGLELDKTRSKLYWSDIIEMSARSFENFIIEKLGATNEQNDYLANFKETEEWIKAGLDTNNYPYPLAEESPTINEKFQQLFETIQEKEESGKTIMFNMVDETQPIGKTEQLDSKPEIISALNAIQAKAPGAAKMVIVANKRELLNSIEGIVDKTDYDEVKNKEGKLRGVFHKPTNTIYISLEYIGSIDEAVSVWVHENGWHKGIRNIVPGNQVDALFEKIYDSAVELGKTIPEIQDIIDHVEKNYTGKANKGNEIAAYLSSSIINNEDLTAPQQSLWNKITKRFNDLIRQYFGVKRDLFTGRELADLIKSAVQSNFTPPKQGKPDPKDYPFLTDYLSAIGTNFATGRKRTFIENITGLFKGKDTKEIREAAGVIYAINEASNYDDEVEIMDNAETVKDLQKEGYNGTTDDIHKKSWRGVTINNKIYIHPRIAKDKLFVASTTVHEKVHSYFNDRFQKMYHRKKYFDDLYNKIGEAEINKVVPLQYWIEPEFTQAEEYVTHLSEALVYRIAENKDQTPETILNELLSGVKDNTAKKAIFEAINETINLNNLQDVINTNFTNKEYNQREQSNGRTKGISNNNTRYRLDEGAKGTLRPGSDGVGRKTLADTKRFAILGETGAANLDKAEEATTRLDNLKVAKEMEEAGKVKVILHKNSKPQDIELNPSKNQVAVYRTIYVNDMSDIDFNEIGNHWTKSTVYKHLGKYNPNKKTAKIRAIFNKSDINSDATKVSNEGYPTESEIVIHKNSNPVQLIVQFSNDENNFMYLADRHEVVNANTGTRQDEWVGKLDGNYKTGKEKTENKSFTPKQILLATGWQRGADGKWRYEVPDGKLKDGWDKMHDDDTSQTLSEVWDDPELFKAYPQLKDVYIGALSPDEEGMDGSYYANGFDDNPTIYAGGDGVEQMTSTLIHEIQHAIQSIEGFARGGNLNVSKEILTTQLYKFRLSNEGYNDLYHELEDAFNFVDKTKASEANERASKLSQKLKEENKELWDKFYDLYIAVTNDPFKVYESLAGETESRNVQKRMNYTPEQRRQSLLEETEDVSRADQIFIYDNTGNSNLIIGETGAQALDKAEEATVRLDNLDVARRMEADKKDAKTILLSTGWQRGSDGKFKYEIPDSELKISFDEALAEKRKTNNKYSEEIPLSEVIKDNELFTAYPELKKTKVVFYENSTISFANQQGGFASFEDNVIGIGLLSVPPTGNRTSSRFGKSGAYDEDSFRSVLLHEIQHFIQQNEGFAGGGNKNEILLYLENAELKRIEENREMEWLDEATKRAVARSRVSDRYQNAQEAYEALSGEVEARNVQRRTDLTPEQRKQSLLAETQDVATKDQITGYSGLGASLEEGIPQIITVNGKERPTTNSNGQFIHPTLEGIKAFYEWFGDSKVVDKKGRPLVVYHGSPVAKRFNSFKSNVNWFADKYLVAKNQYSSSSSDGIFQKDSDVFSVYLKIENPYRFDAKKKSYDTINHELDGEIYETTDELAGQLKDEYSEKYDGLIIQNVDEEQMFGGYGKRAITDDYAVFEPTQIKSSTGNNGNFDENNPNINLSISGLKTSKIPLDKLFEAGKAAVRKRKTPRIPKSVNPDVDKNIKDNRGLKNAETLMERLKRKAGEVRSMAQHFDHIKEKDFRAVYNTLRKLESVPDIVKKEAYDKISQIIAPIIKNDAHFEAFERYVILNDLMSDINRGKYTEEETGNQKPLPWGYKTFDEVRQDAAAVKKYVEANPVIKDVVAARNKMMKDVRNALIANGLLSAETGNITDYFHHQVMEHRAKNPDKRNYPGLSISDARVKTIGAQKGRIGSDKAYNTNYLEAEFEVLAQTLEQLEVKSLLEQIGKEANIIDQVTDQAAEAFDINDDKTQNWKQFIPPGHTQWRPLRGTVPYKSISDIEKAVESSITDPELANEIMEQTAFKTGSLWVIPNDLAMQLNSMITREKENPIEQMLAGTVALWKVNALFNPFRAAKYMLNNAVGDIDIVMAYAPGILKYAPQATVEIWQNGHGKPMSEDMREALHQRVIGSGMTVNELQDINNIGVFKAMQSTDFNVVRKYLETVTGINNFRENILRLAAYKYFKAQVKAGKKVYGASKRKSIDAIVKPEDKAGRLAADLMIDYGNVSRTGAYFARHTFPFWRWVELNAPRYYQMFKNAAYEEERSVTKTAAKIGLSVGLKGAKGAAVNYVKYAISMHILYALIKTWNMIFHPDEDDEEELVGDGRLYLILGKDEETGNVRKLRVTGAWTDVLSFFGLEDGPNKAKDVITGKNTIGKELKESGKTFVNRFAQGSFPVEKTVAEVLFGKTIYPDIFSTRPIRDKGEHIARNFAVDKPYNLLQGKPSKGIKDELKNFVSYSTNPGEASYYKIRNKVYDFLDENSIERPSGTPTKRSNLLYYYKQSKKMGDEEAAKEWMDKYKKAGGTGNKIEDSIDKGRVLSAIPKDLQSKFIQTLDEEDKQLLRKANKWYNETYGYPKIKNKNR